MTWLARVIAVWLTFVYCVAEAVKETHFYDILGVKPEATVAEIKKSYRALAKEWHPDNNSSDGAVEKFQELQAAYEVLADETMRARYDKWGKQGLEQAEQGGSGFGGSGFDIFDFFNGGGQRNRREPKAEPLEVILPFTLVDFAKGVQSTIQFQRYKPCPNIKQCLTKDEKCAGKGMKVEVMRMGNMQMQTQTSDPNCHGPGQRLKGRCDQCPNGLREYEQAELDISLPPGFGGHTTIHVAEAGNLVDGVKQGDVIIRLEEVFHPVYRREGHNLFASVRLKLHEALTGFKAQLPGIAGRPVVIERDTPVGHGMEEKLRGRGLLGGDLIVTYMVDVPEKLSARQRELINEAFKDTNRWIQLP